MQPRTRRGMRAQESLENPPSATPIADQLTKPEMKELLTDEGIEFDSGDTKAELEAEIPEGKKKSILDKIKNAGK